MPIDSADPMAHIACTQSAMLATMALPEDWDRASALLKSDPDENELIVEFVKRLGSSKDPATNAVVEKQDGFHFQLPSRISCNGINTAAGHPSSPDKLEDGDSGSKSASDLTRGDSLAGNPLAAARQKRLQKSHLGSSCLDIRNLLRLYRTYEQPSCLSEQELEERRRRVEQQRPCTPDVRVRATGEVPPRTPSGIREAPRPWTGEGRPNTPSASSIRMQASFLHEHKAPAGTAETSIASDLDFAKCKPVPPPISTKPINCWTSKMPPRPPEGLCSKNGSFRRVRGLHTSIVPASTEVHETIPTPKANAPVARSKSFHRRPKNEAPEILETKEIDVFSAVKILSPKDNGEELSSAEAQMMMNMNKLVQGSARFY